MTNVEARMSKEIRMTKHERMSAGRDAVPSAFVIWALDIL